MVMSEVFWSFFVTSMIGFIIAITKMCYKSKCKEVDICCIKIVRDIALEEKETEFMAINQKPEEKEPV